ncbi:ras and Rab interactor 2 isoform 2-T2 [Syngnathus typhle]
MEGHSPLNRPTSIRRRRRRRRMSRLELLSGCQKAWFPAAPWDRERAHSALSGTPAGSFVVVRDCVTSLPKFLCVSMGVDNEVLLEYHITCAATVFQLSGSRLCFSDLAKLVFFYSLTRDVLALCLRIPCWMDNVTERTKDHLSQLEPEAWLSSTPPDQISDEITHMEPTTVMCAIQATGLQTSNYRQERRLSSTRTWAGASLMSKRTVSLDQESLVATTEGSGLIRAKSEESPPSVSVQEGVVLRHSSNNSTSSVSKRASTGSLPLSPELLNRGSHGPHTPHRVSWIEDGPWPPPAQRPSSFLQAPSPELDSLSISSIEEEQEEQSPSPAAHQPSAQRLADKVIHRFSAVGQALGSLVCQKKRLTNRVLDLSEKKRGSFADAAREFVEVTLQRGTDPGGLMGSEFLQELRSSLTSLRETLLDYPDIQALLDSMTDFSDSEIDSLVEMSVHKVALKPVSAHIYSCISIWRTNDGSLQRLQNKQRALVDNGVEALGGAAGVGVPDSVTLERIQQRWLSMHEAYSPNKKVRILLKICKSIYHSMSSNASSDVVFGADDFLPCLTWVLLRSELVNLQIDTDYMMELLDPTQLQGEGGYYLTTLYAALYYISSFQPRLAARQLSVEAQHSLSQWHRRRTLHSNQSRHSLRRQTIRRQTSPKKSVQAGETESGDVHESGKDEPQQETESSAEVEGREDGDQDTE